MFVHGISIYRPAWVDATGQRVLGADEDETTAVVAALRALPVHPNRIVVVSQAPQFIEGDTAVVIAAAVGGDAIAVERRLGGADSALDAVLSASPGTAVVAAQLEVPSSAAAVLVGESGACLVPAGRVSHSLPTRMWALGDSDASTYDDPRLLRERGWRPAIESLRGLQPLIVAGVPAAFARTVGALGEPAQGPVSALLGLAAALDTDDPHRLVALNGASAIAGDIVDAAGCRAVEEDREPIPVQPSVTDDSVDIPISLAAYERAFDAKLRLEASQCTCGVLEFPPRPWCSECGGPTGDTRVALPRSGSVYTTVSVRIPVPGVRSPYSIAIVDLDGVELRVLAPVTDVPVGSAAIGERGSLVLRRIAVRRGVPDYGYSFQPSLAAEKPAQMRETVAA